MFCCFESVVIIDGFNKVCGLKICLKGVVKWIWCVVENIGGWLKGNLIFDFF